MEKNIETIVGKEKIFALADNVSILNKNNLLAVPIRSKGANRHNAARITTSVLGLIMGLGGASHGPGEILQGSIVPGGVLIEAWPSLTVLAGEPAMTIVPNFLVTGILTIIFGFLVAIWALKYTRWTHGGLGLILLSIIMLLVGGGLMPPIGAILAGLIGMRVNYDLSSKNRFVLNLLAIATVPVGVILVILII